MRNIKATRVTERAGVNHVRTVLDAINQIVQETGSSNDFGEDLYVNLVADGARTGDLILIQVKSGSSYKRKDSYRIPVGEHLDFWRSCNVPVFGVVYDTAEERAYWVNVSKYLSDEPASTTIKVAKVPQHELSRSTAASFVTQAVEFCTIWHRPSRPLIAQRLSGQFTGQVMIGRESSIRRIEQFLHGRTHSSAVISGIAGMGKTTLARAVAARAADTFPGGVVVIDMHGFDAAARRGLARDAYRTLLLALGVGAVDIPNRDGQQAALYHAHLQRLADEGKAVLVVFDNIADSSQVVDLIPSAGLHRTIITSREKLSHLLDADHVVLAELSSDESIAIVRSFLARASARRTVTLSAADYSKLAQLCGHLPLALKIVVGILAEDPHLSVAALNEELETARSKLDVLHLGDLAVRTALSISYTRLSHDLQRQFILLATIPDREFAVSSAATVWKTDVTTTSRNIRRLGETLLIEATEASGRWRMHDLVYAFGRERLDEEVSPEEREAATLSLLELFAEQSDSANSRLRSDSFNDQMPLALTGVHEAIAWFDHDLATLTALVDRGLQLGPNGIENSYYIAMNTIPYLDLRRQAERSVYVSERALAAAKLLKDIERQVRALNNVGLALTAAGRFEEARKSLLKASAIAERRGYKEHEALSLASLSAVERQIDGPLAAIPTLKRAVALARASGIPGNLASSLTNLGMAYRESGQYDSAVNVLEQALPLHHASHNNRNTGSGYANLGLALIGMGRIGDAMNSFIYAKAFYAKAHDDHGAAMADLGLGRVLVLADKTIEAEDHLTVAYNTARDLGDRRLEGEVLMEQANSRKKSGDPAAASQLYSLAAGAYADAGFPEAASLLDELAQSLALQP